MSRIHAAISLFLFLIPIACSRQDSAAPPTANEVAPPTATAATDTAPVPSQGPAIRYDVASDRRATAERALRTLETICPLPRADLAEIAVKVNDLFPGHHLTETYGWQRVVQIDARFRELDQISARWQGLRAGGHTMDFTLGAGRAPGIAAMKRFSRMLCGMEADSDRTQHRAVAELAFLDELNPVPTRPTPKRIDFKKLFTLDAAAVEKLLGPPAERNTDEGDRHVFPDMVIGIQYMDGKAAVAWLTRTAMKKAALRRWVGKQRGVIINDYDNQLCVSTTRLPATKPDLGKLLGATSAELRQQLGAPARGQQWERDGYDIIAAEYSSDGIVSLLTITPTTAPPPSLAKSAYRRWAGLPGGKSITVRGHTYDIELDDFEIVFMRRR